MSRVRRGIIVEGSGAQVRVQFPDEDMVSPWLDLVTSGTRGARIYRRPKVGSQVAVAMDRNGEHGVVLGAMYSDADPAPADGDDQLFIDFADGTTITYDEASSELDFQNAAGLKFALSGQNFAVTGNLSVSGNVEVGGNLTVSGNTELANTKINGVTQTGN